MFNFLHEHYFPRVAFGPVYLAGKKTKIFDDSLQILGYEGGNGKLRPSEKHWQLVREWPIPSNKAELDAFLWLTPFLRIFIPGRAAHVMKLKQAYLQEVPLLPRQKKMHAAEMEDCDGDFTKKPSLAKTPTKPSIRKTYVEKDEFTWGPDQELSFAAIRML